MNTRAHAARIHKLSEKNRNGEVLTDREVRYVKAVWTRMMHDIQPTMMEIGRAADEAMTGISRYIDTWERR